MFQCPACGELLEALTNVHCRTHHRASRTELIARYGTPKYIIPAVNRDVQRWIRDVQVIKRLDFDLAQAAARNQR
ncbi:hypothetical protein [Alicyclobacillus sp. ALC3]|uniref:hypothetical protein n=1 Tax=Alicyclobacillus sp. ALC3 TaxID=2796143 RepID=UPI0023798C7E|nr:hypothetical protein [Alicyclobacillus sp. ALC3]WDL98009.1 hypothetical protein JC200_04680 [Alicyclobacillus sp. ALC3]